MKTLNKLLLLGIFAVMALFFSACGNKDSGGGTGAVAPVTVAGQCTAGYVYSSSYGCLPQSGCPIGYGMYNNQCIPATTINGGAASCQGTCQAGYTQTAYGCFPQGGCMSCYGYNQTNGWCYPGVNYSSQFNNGFNGYSF